MMRRENAACVKTVVRSEICLANEKNANRMEQIEMSNGSSITFCINTVYATTMLAMIDIKSIGCVMSMEHFEVVWAYCENRGGQLCEKSHEY